jgi:3-dehydroquinate dehydratase / shikimate dehydrogenase
LLLRQAIAAGVEYVDLEEDIAASIPRFGKTKRIVSYHNFDETPEDLTAPARPAVEPERRRRKDRHDGPQPARQPRLMRLMRASRVPTIAFCMGEFGQPSRILAGKFGAPSATPPFTPSGRWPRARSAISR